MIRLVNATTRLRVSRDFEHAIVGSLEPAFVRLISERRPGTSVDIHLVNESDHSFPSFDAEGGPSSMDWLGIYLTHDCESHRAAIKVSPERIVYACDRLPVRQEHKGATMNRFEAMVIAVVAHELTHYALDDRLHETCQRLWEAEVKNWSLIMSRSGHPFDTSTEPPAHYFPVLRNKIDAREDRCRRKSEAEEKRRSGAGARWRWTHHVVEESLANAIAIRQRYSPFMRERVEEFIQSQQPPYMAGLAWKGSLEQLLLTGQSWRRLKGEERGSMLVRAKEETAQMDVDSTNVELVSRLLAGEAVERFLF